MAARTASARGIEGSSAAMAEDSVQAGAVRILVAMRGAESQVSALAVGQYVGAFRPAGVPALQQHRRGAEPAELPRHRAHAAGVRGLGDASSAAPSGRFGVTTSAIGISRSQSAAMASVASSRSPLLAIITGSSTICRAP